MKKVFAVLTAALFVFAFAGCSNDLNESDSVNASYGTIILNQEGDDDSRSLVSSELTSVTVTVSGYGMDDVSATAAVSDGTGEIAISGVKTGRNRVIKVSSNVTGAVLYELIDEVKSGSNEIDDVTWATTPLGAIFYNLIKADVDVSSINKSVFESVIPTDVHASLVDAVSIASDYKTSGASGLKTASSYKLATGTVTATVYGYSGKTVQIADPASSVQTAGADGSTVTFTDVLPGTWKVYADGTKVGTVTVTGDGTETIQIGHEGYRVHLYNAGSAWTSPSLYAYSSDESNKYSWPGNSMTMETNGFYIDLKDTWVAAGDTRVIFYQNDSNRYPADGQPGVQIPSGVTEAWFNLETKEWTTTEPFENRLSDDATLASISVNGKAIEGFSASTSSYTASITSSTTAATVTAVANDSAATVSLSPNGSTAIASGASKIFTITVTAEDGTTTKTYTVTVNRAAENDTTLASVLVNGKAASISGTTVTYSAKGTDDSFTISTIVATAVDSSAEISYPDGTTGTIADGASKAFTITVTNGGKGATYTLTVSYTKVENTSYYQTNSVGFGKEKTITIDGDISDWSSDMLIAQGVANDDPRVYRPNSMYEMPIDLYAMYGAYDDNNLYLMVEFTNVQDIVAPSDDYPLSQGYLYQTQNLPFFIAIDTGKGNRSTGAYIDDKGVEADSIWGSGITWESGFTDFIATSTNLSNGPWYYPVDESGRANGINGLSKAENGIKGASTLGILSSKVIGLNGAYGETSSTCPRYIYDTFDSSTGVWVDFNELNHNTSKMDFSYEFSIPLSVLGITKEDITSSGVGVSFVATFGTSGMDCLPYSRSMQDNADQEATLSQANNSKEKEDEDVITEDFARIGK